MQVHGILYYAQEVSTDHKGPCVAAEVPTKQGLYRASLCSKRILCFSGNLHEKKGLSSMSIPGGL
jgi:hypothetical protein